MQRTISFTLSTLLCLSLLLVSGCGGGGDNAATSSGSSSTGGKGTPKDPKTAMTDAAKQLLTADKEYMSQAGFNGIPLEKRQGAATTYKTKANAVNLDGCPDDYKAAFVAFRQACIVVREAAISSNDVDMRLEEESQKAAQQFMEVCEKHGVDIRQISSEIE